jgi:hypothetical protein
VKLLAFFVDGAAEVLSDELRLEMMTEASTIYNHSRGVGYGYGLSVQGVYPSSSGSFYETPFVWHDGGTLTMTSLSFILPEQHVTVSVLANGLGEDALNVAQVASEAAAKARFPARSPAVDIVGVPRRISRRTRARTPIRISARSRSHGRDNHLVVSAPVLEDLGSKIGALEPVGNDLFSWTSTASPSTFRSTTPRTARRTPTA